MRTFIFSTVIIVILGALGVGAYYFIDTFTYTRRIDLPPQLLASSSTEPSVTIATSSFADVFGQKDPQALNPASSTIDRNMWKNYTNNELGFSVSYPADLISQIDTSGTIKLIFPKDRYFHWPLLDDVIVLISATSSCLALEPSAQKVPLADIEVNGYKFVRGETADAAAGTRYSELVFDLNRQDVCYRLDLTMRGTNGAGFYVNNQSLITKYDDQHQVDVDKVIRVFMGIVNSFRIVETPAGTPEDQMSPQ